MTPRSIPTRLRRRKNTICLAPMLTESNVIAAVCRLLETHGFEITQRLVETQQGDDIIAIDRDSKIELVIEAKGETSSKLHTARYGQPFSSAQVSDHVAKALFRAAQAVGTNRVPAVALPMNLLHVAAIEKVSNAMRQLNIEVFWVLPDHTVQLAGFGRFGANNTFQRRCDKAKRPWP